MISAVKVEFRAARAAEAPGAELVLAMKEEMADLYEGLDLDAPEMPKAGPEELSPPTGAFLIGWDGDRPVCCGGVKRLPDGACEIKRMFVVPDARRQGVARKLLRALEAEARRLGYAVARLDTGPKQPHAKALYTAEGYMEIPNFNANPVADYFAEKPL